MRQYGIPSCAQKRSDLIFRKWCTCLICLNVFTKSLTCKQQCLISFCTIRSLHLCHHPRMPPQSGQNCFPPATKPVDYFTKIRKDYVTQPYIKTLTCCAACATRCTSACGEIVYTKVYGHINIENTISPARLLAGVAVSLVMLASSAEVAASGRLFLPMEEHVSWHTYHLFSTYSPATSLTLLV